MKMKSAPYRLFVILVAMSAARAFVPVTPMVEARQQSGRLLTAQEVKELPAKAKRFALVIGIDEYQDTQISRLSGATNDAKALAAALVRYAGFPQDQVILLASDQPVERQPTRGNILRRLSNLKGVVPADGLLLVSFAGHGIERGGRGFLCTSDAQINGDVALIEDTTLAVETMHERIHQMGVKQVLIILDACRNDPSGRGDELNRLTDGFAQRFNFDVKNQEVTAFATLYATDVGHVAYEYKEKKQGYFTYLLIEGLKGGAANERGEVTLGGLVQYVEEQVPKRVRLDLGQEKSQKPYFKTEGYKANELVLSVTAQVTPDPPVVATLDPAVDEREFWSSIKTSADADDFKAYLEKYPTGTFASLARNKLKSLEPASKPPSLPSSVAAPKPITFYGTWELDKNRSMRAPLSDRVTMVITQDDNHFTTETTYSGTVRETPTQKATYNLDGSKTNVEIGGRSPGKETLWANWLNDGQTMELNSVRHLTTHGIEETFTTQEHWELSDGGRTLKIHRVSENPRGKQESTLTFNKQ